MPHLDDLCHCWACGTPFLVGHTDGHHCSAECARATRRRQLRKDRRELVAKHGPASVQVAEFDQEYAPVLDATG